MKKQFLTFALCAFAAYSAFAQAPQKFNYQGVARSATGSAIANQSIGLRISILDGSSTGTAQYVETQTVTTNALGLYNLQIGGGSVVSGTFANITWGSGNKYIKVEADPTGGSSYTTLGTSQLLSVPYALYAANATTGGVSGTKNYVSKFTSASAIGNSSIYDSLGKVSIGSITPIATLDIRSVAATDSMLQYISSTYNGSVNYGVHRVEYSGTSENAAGSIVAAFPPATQTSSATGIVGAGNNTGVDGRALNSLSAPTSTLTDMGVLGQAYSQGSAAGVFGYANNYTGTAAGTKIGVYGTATGGATNYAGFFNGNVQINGTLAKSSGTFKIDNPMNPANEYLYHSFVESPDMMNVYNGNITTDANGKAVVTLPDYFQTLNKDFRYQLTVIGTFAQAIVAEKVNGNKFVIKTNQPNVEVSWQVTGIRQDAFANAHRVVPVVEKEAENKGKYLNPVELGKDPSLQIGRLEMPKTGALGITPSVKGK
ncbi:autotransporter outer membrane beta-barrel domain-containing protein [Taibaiella soli]|uniref:Peptidase S74 domain-containing protein n=1 Tax=Taibaiella soli TaxID=1649169 RepID=A0A2W2AB63_9BACT|nr:hypothetical protein [Taibaiella soli]PZF72541.1 hypothetical protein DN068_11800 [Taibaiella soli]